MTEAEKTALGIAEKYLGVCHPDYQRLADEIATFSYARATRLASTAAEAGCRAVSLTSDLYAEKKVRAAILALPLLPAGASEGREERMALFQFGDFRLASGEPSTFKIECDALTDADWKTLARLIAERAGPFTEAVGVPRGGLKLAECLNQYFGGAWDQTARLIVDDVLTTGGSILRLMKPNDKGFVVFARGPLPPNVRALFTLEPPPLNDTPPAGGHLP